MKHVEFQIISWQAKDEVGEEDSDDNTINNKYMIELYGRTKDDKTVYLKVTDYKPFFYIELKEKWKDIDIEMLVNEIKRKAGKKFAGTLFKYEVVKRMKLKEFNNYKQFPFLRLVFTCFAGFNKFKYMLNKGIQLRSLGTKAFILDQYESNLDPYLRCMHIRNIQAVGWVSSKSCNVLPKTTTCCDINLTTKWIHLDPIEDSSICKVKILAYDIECYSDDGSFPQPNKAQISMIGSTFSRYGESDCYYKHIIVIGSCKPIEGAEVVSVATEEELLLTWTELVRKTDPDIFVSFNGFSFDNRFMYERARILGIEHKFMKLARLNNVECTFIEQKKSSSAMGENINYFPSFEGRVQVDLMKMLQESPTINLSSYSLDFVASTYIREEVLDIIDGNRIKTKKTFGLEVGRYISINSFDGLSDNQYGRDEKFVVTEVLPDEIVIDRSIDKTKLDFINHKIHWCQAKDDISPADIFASFKGSSKQRCNIAKYCIQDCSLLNTLMKKLSVISSTIGMANVCSVPLSFIFMRGQGIKIFSLVAKRCRLREYLIPTAKRSSDIEVDFNDPDNQENTVIIDQIKTHEQNNDKLTIYTKYVSLVKTGKRVDLYSKKKDSTEYIKINKDEVLICKCNKKAFTIDKTFEFEPDNNYFWVYEDSSYEGATVFAPSKGIHRQPVAVLDYKSLYPSCEIMNNMSHETCISGEFDRSELEDEYDLFQIEAKMGANKIKTITFVRAKDGTRIGILPEILIDLLKARSDTRKLIPLHPDLFEVLEGLQLAYKTVANSLYGQTGSKVSAIYKKEIAAATTATGRDMLIFAKDFMEQKVPMISDVLEEDPEDKESYYNVMDQIFTECNQPRFDNFFTKLFTTPNNTKIVERRKQLNLNKKCKDSATLIEEFKECKKKGEYDLKLMKQVFYDEIQKEMLDIMDNAELVTHPKIVYGDSVTGCMPILLRDSDGKVFVKTIESISTTWTPYPQFKSYNMSLINKEQDATINLEVWTDSGWSKIRRIIRHKTNKRIMRVVTNGDVVEVTEDHSLIMIDETHNEINNETNDKFSDRKLIYTTPCNLDYNKPLLTSFPKDNFLKFDDIWLNLSVKEKIHKVMQSYGNIGCFHFSNTDPTKFRLTFYHTTYITVMDVYIVLRSLNFDDVYITMPDPTKPDSFHITNIDQSCLHNVKTIIDLGKCDGYVYDLETESGHFHAGLGQLIVKNTDSVFFSPYFKRKDTGEIITSKVALEKAIKLGHLSSQMTFMIMRDPMELEYEKTYWPLCLLSKKRYVGNLYESNPNKYYQKCMGIVLKRRDNAPIVKIVVGAIVRELLNNTAQGAVDYTKKLLNDIVNGKILLEKYIMTKTLKESYKDRTKIAHAVLADRIQARTGNKIASNTRMPYVYFHCQENDDLDMNIKGQLRKRKRNTHLLQGDKIEDPDYIVQQKLKVDTLFYLTNQIMKPACQFLELVVDDPEKIFMYYINREINRRKGKKSILAYNIYSEEQEGFTCDTADIQEVKSDSDLESSTKSAESSSASDSD